MGRVARSATGRSHPPPAGPVKRNRFIQLDGAVKSVNRDLEAMARDWPG